MNKLLIKGRGCWVSGLCNCIHRIRSSRFYAISTSRYGQDDCCSMIRSLTGQPPATIITKRFRSMCPTSTHVSSSDFARSPSVLGDMMNGNSNYFEEHISAEEAEEGLRTGELVKGVCRINRKKRTEAFVTVDREKDDWIIPSEKFRNRAFDGDVVVLCKVAEDSSNPQVSNDKKSPKIEGNDCPRNIRGKVVFIAERSIPRTIPGFLTIPGWLARQNGRTGNDSGDIEAVLFVPQDNKWPYFIIKEHNLGQLRRHRRQRYLQHYLKKKNRTIFTVKFEKWGRDRFPQAIFVDEIGEIGNIEAETKAIFAEYDIDDSEFSSECIEELPKNWKITDKEIRERRDLRKKLTMTIDPESARDLDDALSVEKLSDGSYEVGVHIADVSHFVRHDSEIDKVARERATTYYMIQKAIHMLPGQLSEEICSLNEGVDRLTFSVMWRLNERGEEIGKRWFGKSVIRSKARLSYDDAQNIYEGNLLRPERRAKITPEADLQDIKATIDVLMEMSQKMTKKRFSDGALQFKALKLDIKLDEVGNPVSADIYQYKLANRLIEEFMLKANVAIAEKISDFNRDTALLRRHPPPKKDGIDLLLLYAKKFGVFIDASSSATLQKSFQNLESKARDNPALSILYNIAIKSMNRAEYFCTGCITDPKQWYHYALAFPLYTHFTSPIRRYADIVVHRLLYAVVLNDKATPFDKEDCRQWCNNCNTKNDHSRLAQERSSMLFLAHMLEGENQKNGKRELDEGYEVNAMVIDVLERRIDVVIPSFGLERKILLDQALGVKETYLDLSEEGHKLHVRFRSVSERRKAIREEEENRRKNQELFMNSTNAVRISETKAVRVKPQSCQLEIRPLQQMKVWLRPNFTQSPPEIDCGLIWQDPEHANSLDEDNEEVELSDALEQASLEAECKVVYNSEQITLLIN